MSDETTNIESSHERVETPTDIVAAFKLAWMQIIAQAWRDDEFREKLFNADHKKLRRIFATYGASVPEDLDLQITNSPEGEGWDAGAQKWMLGGAKLLLPLPPAPDTKEQAVALANYEYSGRAYPFSCCC